MDIFLIIALVIGIIIFFIGVIILDDIKIGLLLNPNHNIHKKEFMLGVSLFVVGALIAIGSIIIMLNNINIVQ